MGAKLDLTGQKFNRLTAVEDVGKDKHGRRLWKFKCDCGNYKVLTAHDVKHGYVRSCGCLKSDAHLVKHGLTGTYEFSVWRHMMGRCYDPKCKAYKNYGGRGIEVCTEWHDPTVFCRWMRDVGGRKGLQLDRKNNNGNYCPENCHFVTASQNMRNQRKSLRLPSGESIYSFCERWLGRELKSRSTDLRRIQNSWRELRKLPDFVFIAMRDRAIADLDAAHKRTKNEQP